MNTSPARIEILLALAFLVCLSGCGVQPTWVHSWPSFPEPANGRPEEYVTELNRVHCPPGEDIRVLMENLPTWDSPAGPMVAIAYKSRVQVQNAKSGELVWDVPTSQPLDVERVHFTGGHVSVVFTKPVDHYHTTSALEMYDGLTGTVAISLSFEAVDGHLEYEHIVGDMLLLGLIRGTEKDWAYWLVAYDLRTGQMTWTENMGSQLWGDKNPLPYSFVRLGTDRLAYPVGARPPRVECRQIPSGTLLWTRTSPDGLGGTRLRMVAGRLLWDSGTRIIQLAPADGQILWQTVADTGTYPGQFWIVGDNLYQEGQRFHRTLRGVFETLLFVRDPDVKGEVWIKCFDLKGR